MANRVKGGQKITPKLRKPTDAGRKKLFKNLGRASRLAGAITNPVATLVNRVTGPAQVKAATALGKGIGNAVNRIRGTGTTKPPVQRRGGTLKPPSQRRRPGNR